MKILKIEFVCIIIKTYDTIQAMMMVHKIIKNFIHTTTIQQFIDCAIKNIEKHKNTVLDFIDNKKYNEDHIKQYIIYEAEQILTQTLDMTTTELFINKNKIIDDETLQFLEYIVEKRCTGIPLSKILNKKYFWKNYFFVNENVLDPRPETEFLVEESIKLTKNFDKNINILELGVGSGCVILSLLDELPNASSFAVDISYDALDVAFHNANQMKLTDRLTLIHGNWFDSWKLYNQNRYNKKNFMNFCKKNDSKNDHIQSHSDLNSEYHIPTQNEMNIAKNDHIALQNKDNDLNKKFELIISNPPYISYRESISLSATYDPPISLFSNMNGLQNYKILIKNCHKYLKNDGYLVLEIGSTQLVHVKNMINSNTHIRFISSIKDYSNNDRIVIAQKLKI